MKKFFTLISVVLISFSTALMINTHTADAGSKLGWHHGHYYIKDDYGDPIKDEIDLVGKYLIDRKGNRHKLNLTKRGNHTRAANRVARIIAKNCTGKTKIEKVDMAAYYVSLFSGRDRYTMHGPYYNTPYGVFIARQYSCSGSAAALQKVLSYMGIKAKHINNNKYIHQ